MESGVAEQLVRTRWGRFELGTGYHGDVWLDLDPLFLRPALLQPHIERLQQAWPAAACPRCASGTPVEKPP